MSQTIHCPNCKESFELKDTEYADILQQVRTDEFQTELARQLETQLQLRSQESALEIERIGADFKRQLAEKEAALASEKAKLDAAETAKNLAVSEALRESEAKVAELAAFQETAKAQEELRVLTLKSEHQSREQFLQGELESLKSFKMAQGSFAIGDDLEKHCEREFNAIRSTAFPTAYFEKDTVIVQGTKGDYVFRDSRDDIEFVSIMFEMKNEQLTDDKTKKKETNESHFAKLHKDRENKKCEYAILVSALEPDDPLYNKGIVDVSHRYPKMYVVRPEFFLPMISILRNAALNSVEFRRELEVVKSQSMDFTLFQDKLDTFRDSSAQNLKWATAQYLAAISQIEDSITSMQAVKKSLEVWVSHLKAFDNKAQKLTIRSLTSGNKTMQEVFKTINEQKAKSGDETLDILDVTDESEIENA